MKKAEINAFASAHDVSPELLTSHAPTADMVVRDSLDAVEPIRPTRVVIVGTNAIACKLAREMACSAAGPYEVIGFIEDASIADPCATPVLGNRSDILSIVDKYAIDEVIVSREMSWQRLFLEEMLSNGHKGLQVKIVPGVYEAMLGMLPLHTVDDIPLVKLARKRHGGLYGLVKPAVEKAVALAGLLLAFPVMLLAVLAIRLTSEGPAVFRQERVGRWGKKFTLYKLRTMVDCAEAKTGPMFSSESDWRVTAVGRILRPSKIDELPQLINVLKGEMSLVGPRPERPCFVEEFQNEISCYQERHRVRPGLTGLAQVYGDYSTTAETKLLYDLMYVYNQSLWLDAKIIFLTGKTLLVEACRLAAQKISKRS